MKLYKSENIVVEKIYKVKCNCCGKEIATDKYGYTSDYLSVNKRWGYNSSFDNENHSFDICENCYKKFIDNFKIQITKN